MVSPFLSSTLQADNLPLGLPSAVLGLVLGLVLCLVWDFVFAALVVAAAVGVELEMLTKAVVYFVVAGFATDAVVAAQCTAVLLLL